MKITKDTVVSIAYQVKTDDGVLIDESTADSPLAYLHGHNGLIPGLENALEGHVVGDKFSVDVPTDLAYGDYNEALVQRVPNHVFTGVDQLEVGMRFLADTDQGPVPVEITEIDGDEVVVDGNHALAGKDLNFTVEVIAVRPATEKESSHGHLHQSGGCCGGHDNNDGCGEHNNHDKKEDSHCDGNGGCGCRH